MVYTKMMGHQWMVICIFESGQPPCLWGTPRLRTRPLGVMPRVLETTLPPRQELHDEEYGEWLTKEEKFHLDNAKAGPQGPALPPVFDRNLVKCSGGSIDVGIWPFESVWSNQTVVQFGIVMVHRYYFAHWSIMRWKPSSISLPSWPPCVAMARKHCFPNCSDLGHPDYIILACFRSTPDQPSLQFDCHSLNNKCGR